MNLEPERKAARRKCSKALAPILDIIRKNAGLHGNAPHDTPPSLSHLETSRALHMGLAAAARGDYRSILREKEKQMETIPKERLRSIGIQNDISLTIKPSSIIIPIAAYGFIAVGAAVIIYLFFQLDHHGIVTKIQYNGCEGGARWAAGAVGLSTPAGYYQV
jgi:hypothetical protein